MPVAVIHEWSDGGGSTANYDAVNERMGLADAPPEGLVIHTAGYSDDGTFRVFDVWESAEAFRRFESERLMPAVKEVMAATGSAGGPPAETVYTLHNVIGP